MSDKRLERVLREAESEREANTSRYNNDEIYQGPTVYQQKTVIVQQPSGSDINRQRCPMPISVVSNDYRVHNAIIPFTGIQLFNDIDQINIEQTLELSDLTSTIDSENRFLIKGDRGQVIFNGLEYSSVYQRVFCGSSRKFIFRIFDRSHQETLFFTRRLGCTTPPFGCYLQRLDVFVPLCEHIGSVQQIWTPMVCTFSIRNSNHCEIFRIDGPIVCSCIKSKEIEFKIYRAGNLRSVTTMIHQWDERLVNYVMTVNFPPRISCNYKALLTACAILLEYMYFEISPSGRCICCCN